MTYIKPQVIIHQEFDQSIEADDTTLRAMIVGPNAVLHRYSDADEKTGISLGKYSELPESVNLVDIGKTDGSIVDQASAKLYIDNALLGYYENLTQADIEEGQTPDIRSALGETNVVTSDSLVFKTTDAAPSSDVFEDRDVQIGDYVWLQGRVKSGSDCPYRVHVSKVIGYSYDPVAASVEEATTVDKSTTATADPTITPDTETGTPAVLAFTEDSAYDALKVGYMTPAYTITVTGDDIPASCGRIVTISITSDNPAESVVSFPVSEDVPFEVGGGFKCQITDLESVALGNKWTVTQKVAYTTPTLTVDPTSYTGSEEDTYIIECTRGGIPEANLATCPLFKITTAKGRDYVGEQPIKQTENFDTVGHYGLKVKLSGEVMTGQVYQVVVHPASAGAYRSLRLQNDIPQELRSTANKTIGLNMRLMKRTDLVLSADNALTPTNPNFEFEISDLASKVKITPTIKLQDYEFGSRQLDLVEGDVYFEFREWVPEAAGKINYCTSLSDLNDFVPGQLDPDNPLKYAIYKALTNSNGVSVGYTAVVDPDDKNDWSEALALLEGEESVYSITPTTQDISILNLTAALIEAESGAEQCRWKTGVFSLPKVTTRMVVGQNTLNNELFPTSTDGDIVLATFSDNTEDESGEFTVVSITSGNAQLNKAGVSPGDELRIIQGDGQYESYTISEAYNEDSLLLKSGPTVGYTNKKIEIWHTMSKLEQAEYYGELAASFGNRRIVVVAPDKVGENGRVLPGYYLAAAVSGYKSGINAYQGMTRTEITGFDDFSLSKPYWSESQLNELASHGVSIVVEDANGTPYIRHALTTDMSDVYHREEVITRDYDYICKQLYSILQRYIGKTSVTDKTLDSIYSGVQSLLLQLRQSDHINDYSDLQVRQHPLLADHVEVTVTIAMPFPINVIEVYITASKG